MTDKPGHFGRTVLEGLGLTLVWMVVVWQSWRNDAYLATGAGVLAAGNAVQFVFLVFGVPGLWNRRYRTARALMARALGAALVLFGLLVWLVMNVSFGIPH